MTTAVNRDTAHTRDLLLACCRHPWRATDATLHTPGGVAFAKVESIRETVLGLAYRYTGFERRCARKMLRDLHRRARLYLR